jgi:hypothetical protein
MVPIATQPGSTQSSDLSLEIKRFIEQVMDSPPPWPSAAALLQQLEDVERFGWRAKWSLKKAVELVRIGEGLFGEDPAKLAYLEKVLTDEAIAEALRGEVERELEFRSTIDDLFRNSASYRDTTAFREMIHFCARFRAYAPFNNMLVRLQNRSCSFYATAKHWKEEFDCELKEDARPMLILAPMHPVMLVYDLDSVENPPLPEKLRAFGAVEGEWEPERLRLLLANAEKWKVRVDFKPLSSTHGGFATHVLKKSPFKMRIAVHAELDEPSRYGILCHELAHIFLGHLGSDRDLWWPSRTGLDKQTVEIEAEAVAHIVLTRSGLKSASVPYLSSYIEKGTLPQSVSVDLITKVAGKIEDMSLHSKAAPKFKAPAKKK